MGNEANPAELKSDSTATTANAAALTTPPARQSRKGWLVSAGAVVLLGAAVAARFLLFPLIPSPATGPLEERKLPVRYVLALPLQAGQRAAGSVYIAEVRGDNELNLSFEVGGVVEQIGPSSSVPWSSGATLAKGTVLAQLKPDEFITRIQAARARAAQARLDHDRIRNLVKTDAVPQQKLDEAATALKVAQTDVTAAEQALNETVLRAPEDGTILQRTVSVAEIVAPGRPVLRFSNLKRMTVQVGVPDTLVGHIRVGQEVPVEFSAFQGRPFVGRVAQVAVAGDEGSRLFNVKIKVPNPDGAIKSGMTASVSFARRRGLAQGVWVPLAALTASPNGDGKEALAVFVIDAGGKARKRIVQTDDIGGNRILVTQGLQAGDKVVVAGVGTLLDGAPVDAQPNLGSF